METRRRGFGVRAVFTAIFIYICTFVIVLVSVTVWMGNRLNRGDRPKKKQSKDAKSVGSATAPTVASSEIAKESTSHSNNGSPSHCSTILNTSTAEPCTSSSHLETCSRTSEQKVEAPNVCPTLSINPLISPTPLESASAQQCTREQTPINDNANSNDNAYQNINNDNTIDVKTKTAPAVAIYSNPESEPRGVQLNSEPCHQKRGEDGTATLSTSIQYHANATEPQQELVIPTRPALPSIQVEEQRTLKPSTSTAPLVPHQNPRPKMSLTNRKVHRDEWTTNAFSQFYKGIPRSRAKNQVQRNMPQSDVHKELTSYKHSDAIQFAETSWSWTANCQDSQAPLPLRRVFNLPTFASQTGIRAYYRVIAEGEKTYTLMACHVNLHGFHRGDLRFVEVNERTVTRGYSNYSVVGNLYLGDVVAVTELMRTTWKEFELHADLSDEFEKECCWSVRYLTVLRRHMESNITFCPLNNGTAVVKGHNELMRLRSECAGNIQLHVQIYKGEAFVPQEVLFNFTSDFDQRKWSELIAKVSTISVRPNSLGTIYTLRSSYDQNEMFEICWNAFDTSKNVSFPPAQIVELCVLMGSSAVKSVFDGRFDCRAFPIRKVHVDDQIIHFSIDNPSGQPTEGRWNCNNRIRFHLQGMRVNGIIESSRANEEKELSIVARIVRDAPRNVNFHGSLCIVSQKEPMKTARLTDGFFEIMEPESNGKRIIEALYGGRKIEIDGWLLQERFQFDGLFLNEYQCDYVSKMLARTPLVLGSSPFGCGKSVTIVATALEVFKRDTKKIPSQQLLVTQNNYASVNLVDIAKKVSGENIRFLRLVSETNWNEQPEDCLTNYDMPVLMSDVFLRWATGEFEGNVVNERLDYRHIVNIIYYLIDRGLLHPSDFVGKAQRVHSTMKIVKRPWYGFLVSAFFIIYQPNVVITTVDSLHNVFSMDILTDVSTIQIDEASQFPDYSLMSLLAAFPNACYGLFGDIRQLPPFCEAALTGRLKDCGIGNTMERALENGMFPKAELRYVYRCHPSITELLSRMFYDRKLKSKITAVQRSEFMWNRFDFWPRSLFPIMFLNNTSEPFSIGTSLRNVTEARLVRQIVAHLTQEFNGYRLSPDQVGVMSFYSAQATILTEMLRGSGVKCGTVDAFQGTERDVVILCCTNRNVSGFLRLANRLNVAMSRARQATIIIGNVVALRGADYWKTIVQEAEANGCLTDTSDHPFLTLDSRVGIYQPSICMKPHQRKKQGIAL